MIASFRAQCTAPRRSQYTNFLGSDLGYVDADRGEKWRIFQNWREVSTLREERRVFIWSRKKTEFCRCSVIFPSFPRYFLQIQGTLDGNDMTTVQFLLSPCFFTKILINCAEICSGENLNTSPIKVPQKYHQKTVSETSMGRGWSPRGWTARRSRAPPLSRRRQRVGERC